jgi:hypothetical protein
VWNGYRDVIASMERRNTTPELATRISDLAKRIKIPLLAPDGVELSPERLAAATSKVIPTSNPVIKIAALVAEVAKDDKANRTLVENIKDTPFVNRFVRWSGDASVDKDMTDEAKRLKVSSTGLNRKELQTKIDSANTKLQTARQKANNELDKWLQSNPGRVRLGGWLYSHVSDPKEKQRLRERANDKMGWK